VSHILKSVLFETPGFKIERFFKVWLITAACGIILKSKLIFNVFRRDIVSLRKMEESSEKSASPVWRMCIERKFGHESSMPIISASINLTMDSSMKSSHFTDCSNVCREKNSRIFCSCSTLIFTWTLICVSLSKIKVPKKSEFFDFVYTQNNEFLITYVGKCKGAIAVHVWRQAGAKPESSKWPMPNVKDSNSARESFIFRRIDGNEHISVNLCTFGRCFL